MNPKPDTAAVTAGRPPQFIGNPVVTPVHREVTHEFSSAAEFASVMADASRGYLYSRIRSPNTDELATAVAALENAQAAHCFASGMAAISAGLELLAPTGVRVVAARQLYGQTYSLLRARGDTAFVDATDTEEVRAALHGSGLLYVETIANPQLTVPDLPAVIAAAHAAGAQVMVDNTVATPIGCRPLEHGADLVVHSATKFLNGHADVLAGVAAGSAELIGRLAERALDSGATLGPDAAWLVRRGLKTLHLRIERSAANAGRIATYLDGHPRVTVVRYPGLAGDESHAVADRLLDNPGGLVVFDVGSDQADAFAVMDACRLCVRATSLGGVETSISHPASTSHRQLSADELAAASLSQGTLRLSVGIEHVDDLLADLAVALA
jgi:cystathionine beta-lyase/cystathionine gamma-synthase